MTRQPLIRYDLYLGDEEVRRGVMAISAPTPEDLLFGNRWIVTSALPATDHGVDYEVFARRVRADEVLRARMTYLVVKCGALGRTTDCYTTRQPLRVATEIVLDVEKWVIREIGPPRRHSLLDGVLIVERA